MGTVKKEARLSGMLLAKKGAASPAYTDHRLNVQVVEHILGAKHEEKVSLDEINDEGFEDVLNEVKSLRERQEFGTSKPSLISRVVEQQPIIETKEKPTAKKEVSSKRIAMTLRMEQDDHLKLRLYAAHSRKSCQEIISEALGVYLCQDKDVCSLSDCKCLFS